MRRRSANPFGDETMKLSAILTEKGREIFEGGLEQNKALAATRLWIVVADQEKAYIFNKLIANDLELVATAKDGVKHLHLAARGHTSPLSHSQTRMGLDSAERRERKEALKFVQKLAEWLDAAEKEDAFDRLAIIAAPRTLGDLRPYLSEKVGNRIICEMDKDLTGLPETEMRQRLADISWF
jgi:protein required for attachment to host cells